MNQTKYKLKQDDYNIFKTKINCDWDKKKYSQCTEKEKWINLDFINEITYLSIFYTCVL